MKSLPRIGAICAVLLCFSPAAASELADPCVGRVAELREDEVVVIPRAPTGGRGVALHACALVDAPPDEVWPVVRDCEKWHQYMPGVKNSRLHGRTGNTAVCEVVVDVPFPLGDLRSVTNIVESRRPDGGYHRRANLLSGDYHHNKGFWLLLPHDGGSKTLVAYDIDFNPDTAVPDFVLRTIQSATAPELLESLRERVKTCGASEIACR
jgi:carbon monoxide dehydrogenase subunit G